MSEIDLAEVQSWAREGGAIAKQFFNGGTGRRKADRTWVTEADLQIEQLLRRRIAASYPHHGVMGEELGVGSDAREFVWCLDPLDGTEGFVTGLPVWGVSIGLLHDGQPHSGVIYLPLLDDCYWAGSAGPAYWNDQQIQVSDQQQLDRSDWIGGPSRAHLHYNISIPGKLRALGSLAAYFCYVARGSAVGALLGHPRLWDIAAGMAILRAAGGVTVTLSGEPVDVGEMLQGQASAEPIVLGTPASIHELLESIEMR